MNTSDYAKLHLNCQPITALQYYDSRRSAILFTIRRIRRDDQPIRDDSVEETTDFWFYQDRRRTSPGECIIFFSLTFFVLCERRH